MNEGFLAVCNVNISLVKACLQRETESNRQKAKHYCVLLVVAEAERYVNDAVMIHKCLKGLSPSYLSDKFSTRATIHERQSRNRDSLNIPSSRINAGQRAFYYRGVKVWNNLSKDLREITNTKVFKRRLINELICNMN